jgi:hypothetical protein
MFARQPTEHQAEVGGGCCHGAVEVAPNVSALRRQARGAASGAAGSGVDWAIEAAGEGGQPYGILMINRGSTSTGTCSPAHEMRWLKYS